MKSIMHEKKEGTCYLCKRLNGDYYPKQTQEHHAIFGTWGRDLAEKHGLKVYLCLYHHTEGKMAVHRNQNMARILQKDAQEAFEKTHTHEEWMEIFGRNYL